jgi:hypothetical protein
MLYPLSYEGGECLCWSDASCRSQGSGLLVGLPSSCPIEIA